jgi:hypothetical protein
MRRHHKHRILNNYVSSMFHSRNPKYLREQHGVLFGHCELVLHAWLAARTEGAIAARRRADDRIRRAMLGRKFQGGRQLRRVVAHAASFQGEIYRIKYAVSQEKR